MRKVIGGAFYGLVLISLAFNCFHAFHHAKPSKYSKNLLAAINDKFQFGPYSKIPIKWHDKGIMVILASEDYRVPDLSDWYQLYRLSFFLENYCKSQHIYAFTNAALSETEEKLEQMNFLPHYGTFFQQDELVKYLISQCKYSDGIPRGKEGLIIVVDGEIKLACLTTLNYDTFPFWLNYIMHDYCGQPITKGF